jgi:transposase
LQIATSRSLIQSTPGFRWRIFFPFIERPLHQWFARRPRYHLHFTPTSASWLNQVERWFAKITQQRIRRGTFTAVKHLEASILDYIQTNNRNPRPFVWTATADTIFAKLTNTL